MAGGAITLLREKKRRRRGKEGQAQQGGMTTSHTLALPTAQPRLDGDATNAPPLTNGRQEESGEAEATAQERKEKIVVQNTAPKALTFSELGIAKELVRTLTELGVRRPTPVQAACIPQILARKDVLGTAETGSGKTLAFALPILQRLMDDPYGVYALIVTPTRELAMQISDQLRVLGSNFNIRVCVIIGGVNPLNQAKELSKRPHLVIACPGRLCNLVAAVKTEKFELEMATVFRRARFLVLDEADRLLDKSFEDDLKLILEFMPLKRQTLLFSATVTRSLKALQQLTAKEAFHFESYTGIQTISQDRLCQQYVFIPEKVKELYLTYILENLEGDHVKSAIVFVGTCRNAHTIQRARSSEFAQVMSEELGINTVSLHSLSSQRSRVSALDKFKSRAVNILIATDVASRGLDIPTVDLVINFDMPRKPSDYVHRVGRTARAGRSGRALSIVTQYDVALVHEIEREIGQRLELKELDENKVLKSISKVYAAKKAAQLKLIESGFDSALKKRKEDRKKRKALSSE